TRRHVAVPAHRTAGPIQHRLRRRLDQRVRRYSLTVQGAHAVRTFLVAAALLTLAGGAQAQKSADTLRWASAYPIDALDPYYNVSREIVVITQQEVWDTLIWRDPASGDYKPLLAKTWKWVGPTTLEFTLRDDVKFQDGRPLTAADAVYTFNYIGNSDHKIPMRQN